MRARRVLLACVVAGLTLAGACGGSEKVGDDLGVGKGGPTTSACRLGECTTTTAPPTTTTTAKAAAPPTTRPALVATTTTAAVQATTTSRPPSAPFVIRIQPDSAGNHFAPSQAAVVRGTVVRFTNVDEVPRSVEADDGSFSSPSIPPGGTFDYVAAAPGRFPYHDGTRPYAVATLVVN